MRDKKQRGETGIKVLLEYAESILATLRGAIFSVG